MSTDFTGTNSEKIDKLVANTIELRTTLRLCFGIVGIGFPLMVGLLAFLIAQSFSTAAKVDRLTDRITAVQVEYERLAQRIERSERPNRP